MTTRGPNTTPDARLRGRPATVVFDEATIQERVRELGAEISAAYAPEDDLLVVAVLKGSLVFLADLVRHITLPLHIDVLVAASYGAGTTTSGVVDVRYDVQLPVKGRSVLLVEDIVDSGTTLAKLIPRLEDQGATRVDVCAFLHKRLPTVRWECRWVGFDAPNQFLVGYGLDHAEDFRHVPYIASL